YALWRDRASPAFAGRPRLQLRHTSARPHRESPPSTAENPRARMKLSRRLRPQDPPRQVYDIARFQRLRLRLRVDGDHVGEEMGAQSEKAQNFAAEGCAGIHHQE